MELVQSVLTACMNIMKVEFTIFGFTLSYWEILIWTLVASVILFVVVEVLK